MPRHVKMAATLALHSEGSADGGGSLRRLDLMNSGMYWSGGGIFIGKMRGVRIVSGASRSAG